MSKYTNVLVRLILVYVLLEQSRIVNVVTIFDVDPVGKVTQGGL